MARADARAKRRPPLPRSASALLLCATSLAAGAATAHASQLIERNATHVRLQVNSRGEALVTYRAAGGTRHVLAWGAVNARASGTRAPQVRFKLDYSGGWATYHRVVWQNFRDRCRPYDGPRLVAVVAACTAPDGSYWALQRWQVALPDLGFLPWLPMQRASWLNLSHWTGPPARLDVYTNWVYSGRYQQVFGRLTYRGQPVYGYGTTHFGAPTDGYGRLVFLDTLNAREYGVGWRRENSFVTHRGTGVFCYGFYKFDPSAGGYVAPRSWPRHKLRGPGVGERYRATVIGPGVTPDVRWEGEGLHPFDAGNASDVDYERAQNARLDAYRDRLCRKH